MTSHDVTPCNVRPKFAPILLVGHESTPPAWLVNGAPVGTPILCATDLAGARDLLERGRVRIAICELHVASGDGTRTLLEEAAAFFPSVAIIGVASRQRVNPDELLHMARTGVHALLFEEDRRFPLLVRSALAEAATRCRNTRVWSELAEMTPDRVRPIVAYGLTNANEPMTVDAAARALGLHRKTLAERCALSGMPSPQQVLGWCRLLAAAVLLEDRGRPVEHVAAELNFPSGAAFRNMLKRYTGLTPAALRTRGSSAEMIRRFRLVMTDSRWPHAEIRVI